MRKIAVLGLLSWLWMSGQAYGVFGVGDLVYDPANHTTNILTSIQTTISAAQAILHTTYMVIDLTAIDGALGASEFYQDLATMSMLMHDARAITGDVKSIAMQVDRLFSLSGAPDNSYGLYIRQAEIDHTLWEVYSYAAAVQSLVATIAHTIAHIRQFWDRIGVLLGNRQALQSLNESQAKMLQAQEKQALMTATFERGETYQRLQEPLVRESLRRINTAIMSDWPTAQR